MNNLYWSVRRELWEHRSIYIGPLAAGALVLAGFAIALMRTSAAPGGGAAGAGEAIQQPYVIAAMVLMLVEMVVAIVYCLDALYGERRDRSILFWKSLPVSDLTAVMAKASIPILLLPLVTFAVTMITQALMLLMHSAALAARGAGSGQLWSEVQLLSLARINLVHLVAFHGLWWAPFFAWLLLASAWATRVPLLWAALPPLAIGIIERFAFNSTRFLTLLRSHLLGGPIGLDGPDRMTMDMLAPHPASHYIASPGFWGGLLLTAILLSAAARLRRARGTN
jgi:ABC-2 type transport system permease protein